jgi:arylsulfatase A-like enzyme
MSQNVLLIIFDAARADAFEPYGAPAGSTPAVSQLARRGGAMPGMFAAGCWTVPSHAALFTGLLPRAAGLSRAPDGTPSSCLPVMETHRDRLLPEVMRRAGYATAAVSANAWLTPESGFGVGFDRFVTIETKRQAHLHRSGVRSAAAWAIEALRARVDDGAGEAGAVLRRWIGEPRRQPFFWFVNLVECHSPYLPPRPYNDLGPIDRLRAAAEARRYLTLGEIWRACAGGFDIPEPALARMRHLYGQAIRSLDDWLGRLLEDLDRGGLLDETLVIVTSDHGENLGENGLITHALSLDNRLLRVPYVVAGPGASAPSDVHSLARVPHLIADAVGVADHPWHAGAPAPGVAVAEFDPPAPREDPRVQRALSEWGLGEEGGWRLTTPMTAATDGRHKLLRRGDVEELYDLDADPLEVEPASPADAPADVLARLRAALVEAAATEAAPATAEPPPDQEGNAERRDLEARMRLLGYM